MIAVIATPPKTASTHLGFSSNLNEIKIRETYCTIATMVKAIKTENNIPIYKTNKIESMEHFRISYNKNLPVINTKTP